MEHVLERFLQLNRINRKMYMHLVDMDDHFTAREVIATMKDAILEWELKSSGILEE